MFSPNKEGPNTLSLLAVLHCSLNALWTWQSNDVRPFNSKQMHFNGNKSIQHEPSSAIYLLHPGRKGEVVPRPSGSLLSNCIYESVCKKLKGVLPYMHSLAILVALYFLRCILET